MAGLGGRLSGAAQGGAAGYQIGGPWGAGIGGALGFLGGGGQTAAVAQPGTSTPTLPPLDLSNLDQLLQNLNTVPKEHLFQYGPQIAELLKQRLFAGNTNAQS